MVSISNQSILWLLSFIASFGFVVLTAPVIARLSFRWGLVDIPNERKIHNRPIPRSGGIGVAIPILIVLVTLGWVGGFQLPARLVPGALIAVTVGLIDDLCSLSPARKFMGQFLAGLVTVLMGVTAEIHAIDSPSFWQSVSLGGLTIFWMVGVMNAFNIIDGLDGLAAGVGLLISFTMVAINISCGNPVPIVISLTIAGGLLGFVKYNFHPARIFLGDAGTMLLGFLFSTLSIASNSKKASTLAVLMPILLLGYPIFDTLVSMFRRFVRTVRDNRRLRGAFKYRLATKSMFEADNDHVHHRLLSRGLTQRKAVLIIYCVNILLAVFAFSSVFLDNFRIGMILLLFTILLVSGAVKIFPEYFILFKGERVSHGLGAPIFRVVYFQALLDLLVLGVCYALACLIVLDDSAEKMSETMRIEKLLVFFVVLIGSLLAFGIYKTSWSDPSTLDAVNLGLSLLAGHILLFILALLYLGVSGWWSSRFIAVVFLLTLFVTLTARFSLKILREVSRGRARDDSRGSAEKVIAAGSLEGIKLLLVFAASSRGWSACFKGVVSEDASIVGKTFDKIPVIGSAESLKNGLMLPPGVTAFVWASCEQELDSPFRREVTDFCRQRNLRLLSFIPCVERARQEFQLPLSTKEYRIVESPATRGGDERSAERRETK